MENLSNYFVEGLQGAGKSTMVKLISDKLPEYKAFREGDYVLKIRNEEEKTTLSNEKDLQKGSHKHGLNANALKLIAIIAMTIDHFTDIFYPGFPNSLVPLSLHFIGRLTAPIMWFFVCEGYHYTKDARKYLQRLGIFAVSCSFDEF